MRDDGLHALLATLTDKVTDIQRALADLKSGQVTVTPIDPVLTTDGLATVLKMSAGAIRQQRANRLFPFDGTLRPIDSWDRIPRWSGEAVRVFLIEQAQKRKPQPVGLRRAK